MPTELKMPALSPTMEEGTLAKWLVKVGDSVSSGDLLAEIETDKATMEFEAIDDGVVTAILVAEGTDGVKVGTVIALIAGEDESVEAHPQPLPQAVGEQVAPEIKPAAKPQTAATPPPPAGGAGGGPAPSIAKNAGDRIIASPLAKRIAADKGIDLAAVTGTGPNGRIVKADVDGASSGSVPATKTVSAEPVEVRPAVPSAPSIPATDTGIPHEVIKLSNMRKTIARRLTESKQTVPHIYLTVDIRLDALLKLRAELNASLEARGIKLSVNDMLIKALGVALREVPACNVSFAGDTMLQYSRSDISVAVSIPSGLITPIITDAGNKSISAISAEMAALAAKAKEGKLQPHEFQGGTASLIQHGHDGHQTIRSRHQPATSDDPGDWGRVKSGLISSMMRWRLRR